MGTSLIRNKQGSERVTPPMKNGAILDTNSAVQLLPDARFKLGCCYRGTSLIRIRLPLGPYRRPMPRVLGGGYGGWAFSYGRGTPVGGHWNVSCRRALLSGLLPVLKIPLLSAPLASSAFGALVLCIKAISSLSVLQSPILCFAGAVALMPSQWLQRLLLPHTGGLRP